VAKAAELVEDPVEKKRLALKAQSEDLSEARKALESAANIARGLWFTFLSLVTYLVIAVGSVTHRNLFLETPVRLPLLNAELPLVAFFWVAPLMFLVFHGYLLLNLNFLADNVRHYFKLVDSTGLDSESKETLYLQLPNFMMVQLLRERRVLPWNPMGYALHGVVILTIVIGPVLALLFLQLQFLPYHSLGVTMLQRAAVFIDMLLILYFWRRIVGDPGSKLVWRYRAGMYGVMFVTVLFSAFVATFPGESNYGNSYVKRSGMTDFLFRGIYNEVTGQRQSWFSDTLALSDEDFVSLDEDKLKLSDSTLSLRGRNLVEANLARADLRKVDFSGANLTKAILRSARLQGAVFARPSNQRIDGKTTYSEPANLQNADLDFAFLQRAEFRSADMRRVKLSNAELEGAILENAKLQGATIANSRLAGVNLRFADMTGASVFNSNLSKADMSGATLTGAVFSGGHMQFANMDKAKVIAAAFFDVNVRGLSDAGVGWRTTLVKDLKSIEEDAQVKKEEPSFATASLAEEAAAAAGGLAGPQPPKADPSLKAAEIMAMGVKPLAADPSPEDIAVWQNRVKLLTDEMCGDKEHGVDIYRRMVFLPGVRDDPGLQFGPFKADTAALLLDPAACANSAALKAESPGLLEEWASPGQAAAQKAKPQ
jgi:uncharacterized protein YjbI with pentapeptide repeats